MIFAAAAIALSAPSFDCAKATTKVETMICADEMLALSDQAVATLTRAVRSQKIKLDLSRSAREWLKSRDGCKDEVCLEDAYEWRIGELLGLTGLGRSYDNGPDQALSVLSLGNNWYAFAATGVWVGSVERGQVNDAEASGVFKLKNGKGSRAPTSDYDCGWRIRRLPGDRWKLENWAGSEMPACGGVNATIEGVYSR
jgi:hypothetical protein